ncbi:conserved exported hypothetical protein [Magnetospirillum sp. LM-5]|uniref:hypothetical protein n=1 Tax=Magnetospirillum sp. LM-5 TaxID=2681466 RepID=UPI00137EB334|nr:hypothetical protein [Magnetospirillum sp. LM-5]CAA7614463.1 conserved exported hypothetical protein [Magnetospirillum sp. LM-5]
MRNVLTSLILLALAGCSLPAPDQPAWHGRMGRFIGLVAQCGCSDITPDRAVADYLKAVDGRYAQADLVAMKGYVADGAVERYDNQIEICKEVCGQACMVNAVAQPMGGRTIPGVAACPVSERDLHLTPGRFDGPNRL